MESTSDEGCRIHLQNIVLVISKEIQLTEKKKERKKLKKKEKIGIFNKYFLFFVNAVICVLCVSVCLSILCLTISFSDTYNLLSHFSFSFFF